MLLDWLSCHFSGTELAPELQRGTGHLRLLGIEALVLLIRHLPRCPFLPSAPPPHHPPPLPHSFLSLVLNLGIAQSIPTEIVAEIFSNLSQPDIVSLAPVPCHSTASCTEPSLYSFDICPTDRPPFVRDDFLRATREVLATPVNPHRATESDYPYCPIAISSPQTGPDSLLLPLLSRRPRLRVLDITPGSLTRFFAESITIGIPCSAEGIGTTDMSQASLLVLPCADSLVVALARTISCGSRLTRWYNQFFCHSPIDADCGAPERRKLAVNVHAGTYYSRVWHAGVGRTGVTMRHMLKRRGFHAVDREPPG